MINFKAWLRKIFNRHSTPIRREYRRQRTARPRVEILETRLAPAVTTTFVNDNWHLFADNDNNGTVSYLDEVRNDNDTISPGTISGFYGLNAFGTVTTDSVPGTVVGSDPNFDTIGEAVTGTNVGGTVTILGGLYLESNILVDKSLSIIGQSRTEVVIAPAFEDDNLDSTNGGIFSHGFIVSSDDVSITTLTLDGEGNTALTVGRNNYRTGIITDFFFANSGPFQGLDVQDVTVKNVYRRGIQVSDVGTGNVISGNTIDGVELVGNGYAIITFGGNATISNNIITNATGGIAANFADTITPAGSPLVTIQGNSITGADIGMNLNGLAGGSLIGGPLLADRNTIIMAGGGTDIGMTVAFVRGQVTVQNNLITGDGPDAGIWLYNNTVAFPPVLIVGNTLTSSASTSATAGEGTGIFLTDDQTITADAFEASYATIRGNTISNFFRGIDLFRNGTAYGAPPVPLPGGFIVQATIGGPSAADNNTISGSNVAIRVFDADGSANGYKAIAIIEGNNSSIHSNTIGIDVDGGTASITNNAIFNNTTGIRVTNDGTITALSDINFFDSALTPAADNGTDILLTTTAGPVTFGNNLKFRGDTFFIDNQDAQDIDLSVLTGTTFDAANNFRIEDKMHHVVDTDLPLATTGLITWVANSLFITAPGGVSTDSTIQRGIDAADATGDTVNVEAGTYTENVILNKQVTLRGAQFGVDARGRVASESIITPLVAATHTLELATGVAGAIVDGFTFSGGTRAIESATGPLNDLQLLNNRILGFTNAGIFFNDTGTDITVHQNVIDGTSKTGGGGLVHLDTDLFNGLFLTNNNIVNGATATGFFVDGNHNVGPSAARTPLISGNLIADNNTGMNLGSRAFGSLATPNAGTISNNTFSSNNFDGLQGGMQNVSITRNTFVDNGRSGLALTSFGNVAADRGAQNTTITENFFSANGATQNGEDIFLSATQAVGTISTNTVFNNSFTSSTFALTYNGTETIDASGNWWGSNTTAGVQAKIRGTNAATVVDFTPWLNVDTDTQLGIAGFQGNFSVLNVDDDSPQFGAVGRITEAIGLLPAPGGTVNIHTGVYTETVDTDTTTKAVILAPGASPGQVTLNGDLFLDANDTLQVDIAGYAAGTGFDQLVVNGTVNLGDATLVVNDTLSNPVILGSVFKIIDNNLAEPVNGEFTINHPAPAGGSLSGVTRFVVNGHVYAIYYDFGTAPGNGNDVALVLSPPFQDDFNRSDSANLGPDWTTQTGTFGIDSNMAATSTSVVSIATVNGLLLTDAIVQAEVTLNAPGSRAGLVARYSGPAENNFYVGLVFNNGGVYEAYIFVKQNAGFMQLGPTVDLTGAFTGTGTLRFEVVGNQMKLFVNNEFQIVAYDSTITSAGLVGMRGLNDIFDDFSATASPPQGTALPFTDQFTKADDSNLDRVWTERTGAFTIQNNAAAATSIPGGSVATLNMADVADTIVRADIDISADGSFAGLLARASGTDVFDSSLYLGVVDHVGATYTAYLFRKLPGSGFEQIASTDVTAIFASPGTKTLRFEVLGNQLKLYVNDDLQLLANDSTIATAGVVGIRGFNSSFDNFNVQAAPPIATTLPFLDNFDTPTNRPDLDRTWTERLGAFTTENDNAATAVPGVSIATVNTGPAANVNVEATVNVLTLNSHAGLVARYSGPGQDNFYVGLIFNNNGAYEAYIFLRQNGVFTQLSVQSLPAFTGIGTLQFQLTGNTLNLFVNSQLQANAVDSSLASGLVGIRALGASLDDFSAS